MDPDLTPRMPPTTLGASDVQELGLQSFGSPGGPEDSFIADERSTYRADYGQGVKNAQNVLPVPPKGSAPFEFEGVRPYHQEDHPSGLEHVSLPHGLSTIPYGGRDSNHHVPSRRPTVTSGPMNMEVAPKVPAASVQVTTQNLDIPIAERIQPTIEAAEKERESAAQKAKRTGFALNLAIGLQVMLGALLTGLSAVTVGKQTYVITSILGGVSTLVASYLARARGTNEPELSISRVKDLDHFLRDCRAIQTDYGRCVANSKNGLEKKVEDIRHRFEELLGNSSGERKLSSPV